ncbi:MORN repeat-containing protein [Toxoplasma gondii ME49]|uniref:MORN repeat-containing protein n=2 Tax=Toxoplasma gondii TaxID=5811 RepID=A0A125YX42_TOXGV|nr:MORN repeat-containing protein [Toxoplasma gondii ME49]EPT30761.1 MORN repeat-containing protein [Toxoplasma gondii ME49]ESS31352.1 MORN repeat-containing protein [Toxoplasma gondii VEG]|eukprot:XP_018637651.1 MORN repeat-containing protein [Toxoplasma gondii ME49]
MPFVSDAVSSNDQKSLKNGSRARIYWPIKDHGLQGPGVHGSGECGVIAPLVPSNRKYQLLSRPNLAHFLRCYRGEWKDNKRHGFGIQTYLDGSTYEGQWREDRRHGHGIMWEKLPSSNFGSAGFAAGAQVSASLLWPVAARQAVGRRGGAGCGRGKVSSDTSAAFSTVFACYIFITKTCGRNKNIAMT